MEETDRSTWRGPAVVAARGGEGESLLTPAEVAALFRVDPKTVTRWAKAGKISSIRTLGGHRRYRAVEVHALLESMPGREVAPASRPTPPPGYVLPPEA